MRPGSLRVAICGAAIRILALNPWSTADATAVADSVDVPDAADVCLSCHAYGPDEEPLEGPTLWGVVGRPVASVAGFDYSPALARLQGAWDRSRLDQFLTDPQAFAPGTRMDMGGVRNADERTQVLDFLEGLRSP